MCMTISRQKTVAAKKARGQTGYTLGYKQVTAQLDSKGEIVIKSACMTDYVWKAGVNESGRTCAKLGKSECRITQAIHVWKTKPTGYNVPNVVMTVRCYNKDFIACGHSNHEVYTRVTVTKCEYNRIVALFAKEFCKVYANGVVKTKQTADTLAKANPGAPPSPLANIERDLGTHYLRAA